MSIRSKVKRMGIIMLALVTALSCLPVYSAAYAADSKDFDHEEVTVKVKDVDLEAAKAEELRKAGIIDLDTGENKNHGRDAEEGPLESRPVAESGIQPIAGCTLQDDIDLSSRDRKGIKLNGYDDTGMFIFVSDPNDSGYVSIQSADLSGTEYRYQDIYIGDDPIYIKGPDDMQHLETLTGNDQLVFTRSLDMKQFDVGYHTIYVAITNGSETKYAVVRKVPTYIYQKVSNSLSNYYTYTTKFTYRYTDSTYYDYSGEYLNMFMDYKKKGGKYGDLVYRMDSSYTNYQKGGLKPNTSYSVRLMLGKTFEYDGQEYTFTGSMTGNASSAKTIKTAYKKPKVKKIKISKGKNKCHKYRVFTGYYRQRWLVNKRTGRRIRLLSSKPIYKTYRTWYTNFKVTVSFKKKQGVAGVCIRTIHGLYAWKNGDKKTYSQSFRVSGKKKGKKISVSVQSYRSKTYGGYSGKYKKKVRV